MSASDVLAAEVAAVTTPCGFTWVCPLGLHTGPVCQRGQGHAGAEGPLLSDMHVALVGGAPVVFHNECCNGPGGVVES